MTGPSMAVLMIFLFDYSYDKEIKAIKGAMAEKKSAPVSINASASEKKTISDKTKKIILISVWCTVFAIAIVLLITGIANGGIKAVLDKANKLCQECIGIG